MDRQEKDSAEEIKRLQRCVNDLISLLALPAIWSGNEPTQMVHMLLDALLRMLRLDFAYARLKDPVTTAPMEILRLADSSKLTMLPQDVRGMLSKWLKDEEDSSPSPMRKPIRRTGHFDRSRAAGYTRRNRHGGRRF